jgi:hypothetical protein
MTTTKTTDAKIADVIAKLPPWCAGVTYEQLTRTTTIRSQLPLLPLIQMIDARYPQLSPMSPQRMRPKPDTLLPLAYKLNVEQLDALIEALTRCRDEATRIVVDVHHQPKEDSP